eukprot:517216-Rhodomonas_salina.1
MQSLAGGTGSGLGSRLADAFDLSQAPSSSGFLCSSPHYSASMLSSAQHGGPHVRHVCPVTRACARVHIKRRATGTR